MLDEKRAAGVKIKYNLAFDSASGEINNLGAKVMVVFTKVRLFYNSWHFL